MNSFDVNITKVRENAIIPTKATSGSAGFDLHACIDKDLTIKKGDLIRIPCGIAIELPSSAYAALIFARSGLGMKYGISLSNGVGVIDSDYRGNWWYFVEILIKKWRQNSQIIITNADAMNFKLENGIWNWSGYWKMVYLFFFF